MAGLQNASVFPWSAALMTPADLIQSLRWRYATKSFDVDRRIDIPTWEALEQSLVLSPSSYGLQPWKFLVVQNPALRQELRPHSWDQSQITDCSHLVVFLVRRSIDSSDMERLLQATSAARGIPLEQLGFYRDLMCKDLKDGPRSQQLERFTSNQVYIALGTFMTSAALLGVDTCPIEGFTPAEYDRILALEGTPYRTCVVCAAGYRAADDKYATLAKVRYPAEELIEWR
jgi:nitroreductase